MEGFAKECFVEFLSSTPQSNQNILSVPEQGFIPTVSHMKIANVYVGTIHQNMRIALHSHISLQFSYQFAIFISVCSSHVLVYSSYVDVCNFHMSLQFSYQFANFMSRLQHLLIWLWMDSMSLGLNSLTPHQSWFSPWKTKIK